MRGFGLLETGEPNGQWRTVRLAAANTATAESARPLAEPDHPWHVAAPMPGANVNVAVTVALSIDAVNELGIRRSQTGESGAQAPHAPEQTASPTHPNLAAAPA